MPVINGDDWNNIISGTDGNDTLWGFGGNDVLFSGLGEDWLDGGAGNDLIFSFEGNDTMFGGSGNDVVAVYSDALWINGGSGNDLLDAARYERALDEVLLRNVVDVEFVIGTGYGDTISGGAGNDTFCGGRGDDRLLGGWGNDMLYGGIGNDTLLGGAGNDRLYGGRGNNVFNGGAGNDIYIIDGRGMNRISQNMDTTTIGNDIAQFSSAYSIVNGNDFNYNRAGNDLVVSIGVGQREVLRVSDWFMGSSYQVQQFVFSDGAMDAQEISLRADPNVQPEPQALTIEFDYRYDTNGFFTDPVRKAALEKAASLWTQYLTDDFDAVEANTTLSITNPQTGNSQSLVSTAAIEGIVIFVGARNLGGSTLGLGGYSASYNLGSDLEARIKGNEFQPWVGSIAFDSDSNWFFDATPDTASDIPENQYDFISVATHEIGHVLGLGLAPVFEERVMDTTQGAVFVGPNSMSVNSGGIPLESDYGHVASTFTLNGQTPVMNPYSSLGERVAPTTVDLALLADLGYEVTGYVEQGGCTAATVGNDIVYGTSNHDMVDGLSGNDRLIAGGGNDQVIGGGGLDTLFGGTGNDELVGGNGDDAMWGGTGDDTFTFTSNSGTDDINDFSTAEDIIKVSSAFGFADINGVMEALIVQDGPVTGGDFLLYSILQLDANNSITIFHDRTLGANNFMIY